MHPGEMTPNRLHAELDVLKAAHPHVEMETALREAGLVLSMIRVDPAHRREGHADAALTALVDWSDRHGLIIAGTPEPVGKGASRTALTRWYRKHGFRSNRGMRQDGSFSESMIRDPRGPAQAAAGPVAAREPELAPDHGSDFGM